MGTGQWSGVDGKRRGENGSGGEPEMRAASGHSEWLGVLDFRLVIFFFLTVRSVTWISDL